MTRHEMVALIKKGWETKGYTSGQYHNDAANLQSATCVCALGAAAFAAGYTQGSLFVCNALDDPEKDGWWNDITSISDNSFSKGAAIENLEKWADRA